MAKRTPEMQSIHDEVVEQIATVWKNEGWEVKADLKGWIKPNKIDGYVPDIEATKTIRRICEVETEETLQTDEAQQRAFEKYCNENIAFYYLFLADKNLSYSMLK